MERETEIELARSLIAGHPQAFEHFVEHFRAKVFHYTWLMCGQREDAEEVSQETLMKVFENFHDLREPERIRPWVFQIARNVCLTKRRHSIFAPLEELSLDQYLPTRNGGPADAKLELADSGALPDQQALNAEMAHILNKAIQQLPGIYRPVLVLRDMEELSIAETAHILDLTEDVVKTRLHRARLALRQKLDEALRQPS